MSLVMHLFTHLTSNIILFVSVLYAPDLGVAGLDTEDVKSRFEVYRIEYHVEGDEPSTVQRDMDETIPFYPEIDAIGYSQ